MEYHTLNISKLNDFFRFLIWVIRCFLIIWKQICDCLALMKSIIEYKMEIFIYVRDFYRAIMKISENNIDVPLPLFDINIKHQE